MGAAERQPISRTECAWCKEPDRWPDKCPKRDSFCREEVSFRCEVGDHRRCAPRTCAWARRWLVEVISTGVAACGSKGKRYAVVSTLSGDEAKVVGTYAQTQQAKPARTRFGKANGLESLSVIKGLVLIVREDGYLV